MGVTKIEVGEPNFNQYAFVDVAAELQKAEAEAAAAAAMQVPSLPVTNSPARVPYQGYWHGVGQVFRGYGNALVGTAQGLYQLVRHPVQSAKGLYQAATHPIQTAKAIAKDVYEKSGSLEGQGEIVGDILIGVVGGGVTKKGLDIARKIPKGSAGKIDDISDTARRACADGCFVEGTQVVVGAEFTEDDIFVQYVTKDIEDVKVGDLVYSYNTVTGQWSSQEVVRTFEKQYTGEVVTLQIGDESIEATANHPFWVVDTITGDGDWVEAGVLEIGDVFLDPFGNDYTLGGISVREESVTVYNFEVAGTHTYLVSGLGILVHNDNCGGGIYEFADKKIRGRCMLVKPSKCEREGHNTAQLVVLIVLMIFV